MGIIGWQWRVTASSMFENAISAKVMLIRLINHVAIPWPFSMWGIDAIGLIHPRASNGHRFILVAADYFTKWAVDASFTSLMKARVTRFIK